MKISRITAYQVDLPMKEGAYSWAGQSFAAFDSTIVAIETDSGIQGAGEICPLGPAYLAAFAEGARAGIQQIAPALIGEDPRHIDRINDVMDARLKGQGYVKSALDMACWDIAARAAKVPLYILLGGLRQKKVRLFKVLSKASPDIMTAKMEQYHDAGFRHFQMKVGGGDVASDILRLQQVGGHLAEGDVLAADANTGWLQHEAMWAAREAAEFNIYLEQPCLSYEECLAVRRNTTLPFILDECIDSLSMLLRALKDRAMDVVNLKISRIGGISKLRRFRDLCADSGIAMTIEDSWGSEVATAAIAHLSHSAPPGFHFQSSAFQEYNSVRVASGGVKIKDGFMTAPDTPGLGVNLDMSVLGKPTADIY